MSKYRKYYCPRRRELFVEIDRTTVGAAGGNVSQSDWDAIFAKKDDEKENASIETDTERDEEEQ